MRVLLQRVRKATVKIEGVGITSIGLGILVFLGIEEADNQEDINWLCGKISKLRIFDDPGGIMNLSVIDVQGEILIVSQFTLHASTKKGNRPSYIRAGKPETALPLYRAFVRQMENETGKPVKTGKFGAMMDISLINDGPVTIMIDSKKKE